MNVNPGSLEYAGGGGGSISGGGGGGGDLLILGIMAIGGAFSSSNANKDEAGVRINPAAAGLSKAHQATNKDRTKPGYGGNCTPDEYDRLDAEKDKHCNNQKELSGNMTCSEVSISKDLSQQMKNSILEKKGAAFGQCARARENLMNACFAGGDAAHRQAAIETWKASNNCFGKIKH